MFEGLFALPAGMATDFFPVNHKYKSLLAGVSVLTKLALISALYDVAWPKFGATEPPWQPFVAQLFVNMGCISFEKLTTVVISGVLSMGTVVVLVQPFITNIPSIARNNAIAITFFDMIFIFY